MADKLIITFDQYTKIVEKLAIEIHNNYKPTVLVGIMRGAAPILDILSRILKLPIAYIFQLVTLHLQICKSLCNQLEQMNGVIKFNITYNYLF